MRNFLIVLSLFIPSFVLGQDFKTVPAKNALDKYKAELKRSEEIKLAAEVQYKKELNLALKNAMQTMNLDEANLIKKAIDNSVVVKVDKTDDKTEKVDSKPDDGKKENKVELKLSDAHNSIVGSPVPYKGVFTLGLKKDKDKKICLNIVGDAAASSLNALEVHVNGECVGNWEYKNEDPNATCVPMTQKTFEVDISKCIKDENIKQYDITFKRVTGFNTINVSEVKATYK